MRPSVDPRILALCLTGSSLLLGNKACEEGSHFDILGPEDDAGGELWVDAADGGARDAGVGEKKKAGRGGGHAETGRDAASSGAAGAPGVGAGVEDGASAGPRCGTSGNAQCAAGQFCDFDAVGGEGCDGTISNALGVCARQPTACTRAYLPVCGCDRRTYGNRCLANGDAVSVLHEGACTELDCEAIGGRPAYGAGPGPMCNPGEKVFTTIVNSDGSIPIEGALCCVAH